MNQTSISRRDFLYAGAGAATFGAAASSYSAPNAAPFRYAKPIIDAHAHLRADLIDDIIPVMDAYHIEKVVTLSMPIPWLGWTTEEGAMALAKHLQPDRIIFFSTVNIRNADKPDFGESEAARIHECAQNGAQGIKMYFSLKGHPFSWFNVGLNINDKRMEPIYAACAELNVPLLIHLGSDEAAIGQLTDAAKTSPKTNFIAAHAMGHGLQPDFLAARLEDNPNLYIDTAAVFARAGHQDEIDAAKKFFANYAERIIFGTDPVMSIFKPAILEKWRDVKLPRARNALEGEEDAGLNLPEDVLDTIYSKNMRRLLGKWNPLNFDYFRPHLAAQVRALEEYLLHPNPQVTGRARGTDPRRAKIAMVPAEIEHFVAFAKKHLAS